VRELKALFIFQRVAEELKVEVSEQEVNALVSSLAAQYNRRPDGLREELERKGSLSQLYVQIREQKAIDELLAKAKIEDAAPAAATEEKKD
jgi:trigger factor